MIEAYKIGASLTLTGDAQEKLLQFIKTSKEAALAVEKINLQLRPLGEHLALLNEQLSKANPHLAKLGISLGESKTNLSGLNRAFTGFNEKITSAAGKTETLIGQVDRLKRSLAEAGEVAGASGAAIGGGIVAGGAGGGGHGRGRFHSKGLHMGAFGFSANTLAGGALAYGAYESLKEYSTYAQAYGQFQAMNLGANANESANDYAMNTRFPGVSSIEKMKLLRDSTVIMKGNYQEAEGIMPALMQAKYTSKALGYAVTDEDLMKILRVAEMRGGFKSPQSMKDQLAYATQGIAAYGGTVTPRDMQNFVRTSGVAGLSQSDKSFWLETLPLIQEMGGSRTGTALMSLYQAFGAGRTTTAAALELNHLGLVKKDHLELNKIGMIKRIKPGGIVNNEQFTTDFTGWLFGTMFPAMKAKGIDTQAKALQELATVLPNRTAANLASQAFMQETKIKAEYGMASNAMTAAQQMAIANKLPQGQVAQFNQAATDLGVSLGKLMMPGVILGMKALTWAVDKFTIGIQSLAQVAAMSTTGLATSPSQTKPVVDSFFGRGSLISAPSSPSNPMVQVHSTIHFNNDVIAKAVTEHQGNIAAHTPELGTSFPDPGISILSAHYNGH